jgi:TP901 family phage tail tape measure protein
MSTVAELQGEIGLEVNPFINNTRAAKAAWDKMSDGIHADASGRLRDSTGKFVKGAEADLNRLDSALKRAGVNFKAFGRELESVGTSLTVGLTAPLLLLGKQIFDVGFSYEKAMNTFQAVTKATASEMSAAAAVAQKLGADMTLPATSAADAALAMTELAKGGFTAAQAMDAAKGSLQLAAAAQIDEARAAEITANALNTFHLAATESVRVSDLLAAASNASSAEINDIALAMQQAGTSANNLNVPIEDLVTAIGEMANAGIKGSDAGTSLKTFMDRLTPTTKEAAAAMKDLGLESLFVGGEFIGLEAVIQKAQPALAKMTTEQRTLAIETAFGSDAQRAANVVLVQGVDAWQKMSGAVNQGGAAAELAAAKTKGLSGAWEGLKSQLETAGLKIFDVVAKSLEGIVRKLADMAGGLADINPKVIEFGVVVAGVAATAGPLALLASRLIALGTGGKIVTAVIAGSAAMAAAYKTDFGAMGQTLDAFARNFNIVLGTGGSAENSTKTFSVVLSQMAITAAQQFDYVIDTVLRMGVSLKSAALQLQALVSGNWSAIITIQDAAQRQLGQMDKEFADRSALRQAELFALQVGGHDAHWRLLQDRAAKGVTEYTQTFIRKAGEAQNAGEVFKGSLVQGMTLSSADVDKALAAAGPTVLKSKLYASGLAAKSGWDAATKQSPFFVIHDLEDAIKFASTTFPEKLKGAGKKAAEAFRDSFQSILGDVNDWLGRGIGGTGTISDDIFGIILRNMPKVGEELKKQGDNFRDVNKSIELYAAVMSTAAGKNDAFALRVKFAINTLLEFDKTLNDKITPSLTDLGGALEHTTIITDRMGKAIAASVGSLVEQTIAAKKAGDAAQKLADEDFKRLLDINEDLSRQIPSSWNSIIDAIVNGSGKAGSAAIEMAVKWKGMAADIVGIADLLPGKVGGAISKVISEIDRFFAIGDKILSILGRMGVDVPATMSDLVGKIIGIFKKGTQDAYSSAEELLNQGIGGVTDAASKAGEASGKGFSSGFLGQMAGIASGIGTFFGTRGQGKVAGVLGGVAGGAQVGASIGAFFGPAGIGIGAGIGAIGGAIAGLFGSGKSKEQKEAEERAKKQAGLDMERFVADLNISILEGLNKGFELLEKLHGFAEVPKKAIRRFIKQIGEVLTAFVEMSKDFKQEGLAAAKAVTENLGEAFGFLMSGADLVEKIRNFEEVGQQQVDALMASVDKILDGWFAVAEHIEVGVAKRSGKIANKLSSSIELLSMIPDLIKSLAEMPAITDEQIEAPFIYARKIIDRFFTLSEEFHRLALNRVAKMTVQFTTIFEGTKALFESLKIIGEYKPIEDSVFDSATNDFRKITTWQDGLLTETSVWLTQTDTLASRVQTWLASLGSVYNAVRGAFGSASSSLTLQPQFSSSLSVAPQQAARQQQQRPIEINIASIGTVAETADPRVRGFVEFLEETKQITLLTAQ